MLPFGYTQCSFAQYDFLEANSTCGFKPVNLA